MTNCNHWQTHVVPLINHCLSLSLFPPPDRLTQVYAKVNRAIVALQYFTTNEWTFVNKNQLSLCSDFSAEDVERFASDVRRVHWPTYIETYILGVRKFLLREDPSTLPLARAKLRRSETLLVTPSSNLSHFYRLYYLTLVSKLALVAGLSQQIWYHYPTMRYAWKNYATPFLKSSPVSRVIPFAR